MLLLIKPPVLLIELCKKNYIYFARECFAAAYGAGVRLALKTNLEPSVKDRTILHVLAGITSIEPKF
jgi:hypothetical protein